MKQGNFIIYPEESMEGEWVKYHFIKDDRALLEEAVLELEGLRDHINQDVMHYVWNEEDKKRIDDFLTRAKERLGGK